MKNDSLYPPTNEDQCLLPTASPCGTRDTKDIWQALVQTLKADCPLAKVTPSTC